MNYEFPAIIPPVKPVMNYEFPVKPVINNELSVKSVNIKVIN